MRCAIWRQHRGQLFWAAAVVFVYGLFILVVGHSANAWLGRYQHWLAQLRAAGCPLPIEGSGRIHVPSETCRTLLAQYRGGVQPAFGRAFNFAVWTRAGKQLELPGEYRVVKEIPGLEPWKGCQRLGPGQVVGYGDSPGSWDSRFFGVVAESDLAGVYVYVW